MPLLKSAAEALPKEEVVWQELVLAASGIQQHEKAVEFAKQAIRHHPRSDWLWRQLGGELIALDKLEEAEKALENARNFNSDAPWLWCYLAQLHQKRKDYAKENKEKNVDLKNSQWIVYDLGGGTFDVALVKIVEGELKIVDHEGDNYLGGSDFDALIVERIVAPQLEKKGKFTDLLAQMKSETGKYNRLWYHLLPLAEQAKIELSAKTSAEIEFSVEDDDGKMFDLIIPITRSEYEALIKDAVDNTADMLKKILTRNSLRPQDLKFVLMVGGVTYTPFVRKRIEEQLGIQVNTGIDPTNAIAVGAAYFAATKEINLGERTAPQAAQPGTIKIRVAFCWLRGSQHFVCRALPALFLPGKALDAKFEDLFSQNLRGKINALWPHYRVQLSRGHPSHFLHPV